jgi:hypothetical protein
MQEGISITPSLDDWYPIAVTISKSIHIQET